MARLHGNTSTLELNEHLDPPHFREFLGLHSMLRGKGIVLLHHQPVRARLLYNIAENTTRSSVDQPHLSARRPSRGHDDLLSFANDFTPSPHLLVKCQALSPSQCLSEPRGLVHSASNAVRDRHRLSRIRSSYSSPAMTNDPACPPRRTSIVLYLVVPGLDSIGDLCRSQEVDHRME